MSAEFTALIRSRVPLSRSPVRCRGGPLFTRFPNSRAGISGNNRGSHSSVSSVVHQFISRRFASAWSAVTRQAILPASNRVCRFCVHGYSMNRSRATVESAVGLVPGQEGQTACRSPQAAEVTQRCVDARVGGGLGHRINRAQGSATCWTNSSMTRSAFTPSPWAS